MRAVTQEHISGCAIACVAALLGISYKRALKLFTHPEYAISRGYYRKEIVQALSKAGKNYGYRKVTAKNRHLIRMDGAIVFLKTGKKYPIGHYVVRLKGRWMDPWLNHLIINPAKGGFRKRLPEKAQWVIYPVESPSEKA